MPGVDGDIVLSAGLDTRGVTNSIKSLQATVSKGLKNAIRIGFGVRSVYALIRKMRTALIKGFQDLAQVHQPFNDAMSQIMTSLNLLRNSFAAAFAPIIETVAPILSQFITMIATAVNYIGMFIAALTGKEYVQAVAVQQNYAESASKSASSSSKAADATKKQAKAAKELYRVLAKFDDVEILKNDKDDSDTDAGSASPAGGGGGGGFTTMPIGNAVKSFVDSFKDAWDKADFTDIGRLLGEKLKNALENIPWDTIKSTLRKVAKSIATFLNGFLETPGLFTVIGQTIAQGINSAFEFVESFVSNFHWKSLGIAFKDLILGAVNTIDWKLIYKTMGEAGAGIGTAIENALDNPQIWTGIATTFANGLNSAVRFVNSTINSINWKNLGTNISTGIKNGLNTISWNNIYSVMGNFGKGLANFLNGLFKEDTFAAVGKTVANQLNGAFEFLNRFGETFNFTQFGSSLAAGINNFLNNFNTARLTSGINTFVTGFRDAIVAFVSKVNWYEFGTEVRNVLKNIPWKIILFSFGTVIWEAINASIKFLKGLFNVDNITGPFTSALNEVKESVTKAVEGIDFDAIASGIDAIVKALKPAVEGFGIGLIHFFDKMVEVGSSLLSQLGPWLQALADAIMSIDPAILTAVGIGLGVFVGALVTINGLEALAGIVANGIGPLAGVIGAIGAHPLLAIGAGLIAVSAGLKSLCDSGFFADEDTKAAIQNAQDVIDSAENVRIGVQGVVNEAQMKNRDIQATFTTLKDLADKYFDLAEQTKLSNEQQQEFENLRATLTQNLPGFKDIIDGPTSSYSEQRDAVDNLITSTKNYYMTLAAEEFLKDYYTQLFNLEVELQKNDEAYQQLLDSYDGGIRTGDLLHDSYLNIRDAVTGYTGAVDDNRAEHERLVQAVNDLNGQYDAALSVTEKYAGAQENAAESAATLTQSQEELGESSEKSSESTNSVSEALEAFDGLGLITPLKIALISAAINSLKDSNKLTDDQAKDLQKTLDNYNPKKPKSSMKDISKAFEDAGVSGEDFQEAVDKASLETIKDFEAMAKSGQTEFGKMPEAASESAKGVGEGYVNEMHEQTSAMNAASKESGESAIEGLNEGAGTHSPSVKSQETGQNVILGFINGVNNYVYEATSTMTSIAEQIIDAFSSKEYKYTSMGQNLMLSLQSGMSDYSSSVIETADNISSSIQSSFDGTSWDDVGEDIGRGIYNGLFYYSGTLEVLAWNTAVRMYNSACRALDIASPSKKFAWIGEMVAKGLGKGVEDNEDVAVDAVANMANALTDEATDSALDFELATSVDNWISSLDETLTQFSDTIVNKFDSLIVSLQQLAYSTSLPAVAQGRVIPSSFNSSSTASDASNAMQRTMQQLVDDQITNDDLRTLLVEMFNQYMNVSFYLGDEQVAQHANAGNLKLRRRYSTV